MCVLACVRACVRVHITRNFNPDRDEMSGCDIASDITRNLSNMSIVSLNPSVCTLEHCVLEANMHMLICSKCKRSTHYTCTYLPSYEIYLYTRKRYRRYICDDCVVYIPDENCTQHQDVISEKIDNLDNTITSLKEELNQKTHEMYR